MLRFEIATPSSSPIRSWSSSASSDASRAFSVSPRPSYAAARLASMTPVP